MRRINFVSLLGPVLLAGLCFSAEKPILKHFYRPLVIEPPKAAAGDPVSTRCTDPSQPCYANNKDVLTGQRTMLGIQDLVTAGLYSAGSTEALAGAVQQTSKSVFGSALDSSLGDVGDTNDGSFLSTNVVSARLFRNSPPAAVSALYSINSDNQRAFTFSLYGYENYLFSTVGARTTDDTKYVQVFSAAGDFATDGREEIVYAVHDSLCVLGAANPLSYPEGMAGVCGTLPAGPTGTQQIALAVAVGHFGPGTPLRAAVLSTIGPAAANSQLYVTLFNVDPNTFAPTQFSRTEIPAKLTPLEAAMAVGKFSQSSYGQLAVIYSDLATSQYLQAIDFDGDGKATLMSPYTLATIGRSAVKAATGRFGLPEDYFDRLVIVNNVVPDVSIEYLQFDNLLQPAAAPTSYTSPVASCVYGLAVGNFDHVQADPSNPGSTIRNPRDQVALLTQDASSGSCSGVTARFTIFSPSVAQDGSFPAAPLTASTTYTPDTYPGANFRSLGFAAVDTQGRSLVLGDPTIITFLERQKISQILAMPPMHIDAIPSNQAGSPNLTLYNFTAGPSGYKASFDLGTQQTNSLSSKYSSTWSFSSQETVGGKYAVGICGDGDEDGDCVKTESKFSAKQALDGSTATDNSAASSLQYELTGETSDSDLVLYSGSALTDYIYPVIGRTVCPGGATSCVPSARVPETVQFAGTDSVVKEAGAGIDLPWYQPVWMFGNVLSYPTNECQLEIASFGACGPSADSAGALQELSGQLTLSSDFRGTQTNTWVNNKSSGSTTAFNQNYSFDLNTSVTAESNELVESGEVSASLDLSGSFGFQSLTDSRTETQASNGIQFTKTSVFQTQPSSLAWGYDVTSRIFGQQQPVTAPDAKVPNNADSPAVPDITSFGTLRTAFVVQPQGALFNGAEGGWYGSGIDIGLNQPRRWYYSPGQGASNNCLLTSVSNSQADCVALSKITANPFQDAFHIMRGLFVVPAAQSAKQPLATGPQIERVKYDQQVILRARVYNFSTLDMAAGQTVHARFYAMPINSGSTPAASTFLGEAAAGGIPHWGPDTNQTNWTYIDFPFTPGSARINQDFAFWVVVWGQNADGSLAPDLAGHGLSQIPPQNVDWSTIQNYEQPYSNNIGFYNGLVYVLGENAAATAAAGSPTSIEIVSAATEKTVLRLGESSELTIRAQTGSSPIHMGVTFKFYDGDPRFGGKLVGQNRLPYLRGAETYETGITYRPKTPGTHQIFVSTAEGTKFHHRVQLRTITVLGQ